MTRTRVGALAVALLLGLAGAGPVARAAVPKPQVFIVVKRASLPGLVKGIEPNDLLTAAERAVDRAEALYLKAMEAWEAEMERALEQGEEPGPMPTLQLDEAVKLAREALAKGGEGWTHADAARYLLGWALSETERGAEGARAWEELVGKTPKSPYAAEAHLRLGERAFRLGRAAQAAGHYEAATGAAEPSVAAFATYMLGWSRYQAGDRPSAIAAFRRVVVHPMAGDAASTWGHLRQDAVASLGVILAEADWDGDDRMDADAGPARVLRLFPGDGPGDRDVLRAWLQVLRKESAPDAERAEAALRERGLMP